MRLWNRKYKVKIETLEISNIDEKNQAQIGLDVQFSVTKTLKKEPNTIDLTIYNLNETHRSELAQIQTPFVQLEAGYEDGVSLIFRGEVRNAQSYKEGPDWITELHSGDGEKKLRNARINKSYKAGTRLGVIVDDLVAQMGVGIGNSKVHSLLASWSEGGGDTLNGLVVSGSCRDELTGILKSMGIEWSVQDGDIQLLPTGQPVAGVAVVLSPETGLIGTPTIGSEGLINMTSLMNGNIVPGSTIALVSSALPKGFYRAERCDYIGDMAGQDWYIQIEGKAL